ncbi:hypothetical protein Tco_0000538 [Tanacetum coccineum]
MLANTLEGLRNDVCMVVCGSIQGGRTRKESGEAYWISLASHEIKLDGKIMAFKKFNYLLQINLDLLTEDIEGFKTYRDYKDDWIYEWNKDVPWVHEKPWTDNGAWKEPALVKHYCEPFNYKNGCLEWPTRSWRNDGYYNGGNLPGAYIVGNTLRYQDFEWYEALKDGKLKEEALKNKAIMEGITPTNHLKSMIKWVNCENIW